MNEGFRGGKGGALTDLVLGGDSRLMSGAVEPARLFHALDVAVSAFPFVNLPFWRGVKAGGPSSTTQSFKSISDDFRPRFGGDGDGDLDEMDCGGVNGVIVEKELATGEMGSSNRLGESEE